MCHKRRVYTSELSDAQWELVEQVLPRRSRGRGRPMRLELRTVVNAILYILTTGCQWRNLPQQYPHPQSVYYHFRKWCRNGTWERVNRALLFAVRAAAGKLPYPSAGVLDSRSTKTSSAGGQRGFDPGKKVKGRKRQILVDTLGGLWKVYVHPANWHDTEGAKALLGALPTMLALRLGHLWADYGYRGRFEQWCGQHLGATVEIVRPPRAQSTFTPLKRRWVVERTFAWLSNYRRLTKEFERLTLHSEGFIYLASIHRSLKFLAS